MLIFFKTYKLKTLVFLTLCAVLGIMFLPEKNINTFSMMPDTATLIIDAGHGGMDGGASSASGTLESQITLEIAQKLEKIYGLWGMPAKMTRENDMSLGYDPSSSIRQNKITDMKKRIEFIENCNNPIFLSIHLNKFQETKYKGAQVFYSSKQEDSQKIAQSLQSYLIKGLDEQNNRKAKPAPDTLYMMKNISCPGVIVECGFLSNPEEAELLESSDYQIQISLSIAGGMFAFLDD